MKRMAIRCCRLDGGWASVSLLQGPDGGDRRGLYRSEHDGRRAGTGHHDFCARAGKDTGRSGVAKPPLPGTLAGFSVVLRQTFPSDPQQVPILSVVDSSPVRSSRRWHATRSA